MFELATAIANTPKRDDNTPNTPPAAFDPDFDRPTNLVEVIVWCKHRQLAADVVGRWVWLKFESKPDQEVRDELKAAGFRWVKKRGEWAHNCGHPCHHGHGNPRFKYGEVSVRAISDRDLASVA